MKLTYDKSADALYIRFTDQPVARTRAATDGVALDFDAQDGLVGLEVLYLSLRQINPYEILCQYVGQETAEPH
jgi:uncharacterized protein YuzE